MSSGTSTQHHDAARKDIGSVQSNVLAAIVIRQDLNGRRSWLYGRKIGRQSPDIGRANDLLANTWDSWSIALAGNDKDELHRRLEDAYQDIGAAYDPVTKARMIVLTAGIREQLDAAEARDVAAREAAP
ncbi:MAG: hypothetical protein ABW213_04005 [Tardiphaga sp.]